MYPENIQTLFENIPIYKDKILDLAKNTSTNLRDQTLKSLLNEYLDQARGMSSFLIYTVFMLHISLYFQKTKNHLWWQRSWFYHFCFHLLLLKK